MTKLLIILCWVLASFTSSLYAQTITVAAASNLRFVVPALVVDFNMQYPSDKVNISFAASGTLTTQIQHGAPFDVFLSASPKFSARLIDGGIVEPDNVINYAQAQFALFARNDSKIKLSADLSGIAEALKNNTLGKVVIANPMHAPYGDLAKQELIAHGLWESIQPHLLIAENASQALQFSLSPQASMGFIPYTYVIQKRVVKQGRAVKLQPTLQQQAVLINKENTAATRFMTYLQTPQAKVVLAFYGFKVN